MKICPNFLICTKLSEMIALSKIKKLFVVEKSKREESSECPIKSREVWN